ncbi:MAG: PAS domain-containing protein [Gemmatimonadaceae bacterium]|nr:PAS domain-containing protein [Gemmatimonadaceae bacterium]
MDSSRPQSRTAAAVAESVDWHAVADALDAHVAVVAGDGRIVAVNAAWRRFAGDNDDADAGEPGRNYLDVCRTSASAGIVEAAAALDGLYAVLRGERPDFEFEYPCHSPTEQRWFLMRVAPLAGSPRRAVVSHTNITTRRRALLDAIAAREAGERADVVRRDAARLAQMAEEHASEHTAHAYGLDRDAARRATLLAELEPTYLALLDMAVEQRAYRVEYATSDRVRQLADALGAARARARDVVELHRAALRHRAGGAGEPRAEAYLEEGRLLLLQLMGQVLTFYRDQTLG